MSFASSLALAVGLLVALPLLAHMLRRGKTQEYEFPPATLVPDQTVTSKRRSRLEDRVLLSLRALSVLALAALGATPLSRCSRLSVERPSGASVAFALVIDDSQSMRSKVQDGARWELALTGASQLVSSARAGDAIAIVQAGRPARVALSPTTDLGAVRQVLAQIKVTDRNTDLPNAVRLAQSLLEPLPQPTKRVVVLSDLADSPWSSGGSVAVSAPLQPLRDAADNCAITQAVQQGLSIAFTVACNSAQAAQGRSVSATAATPEGREGTKNSASAGAAPVVQSTDPTNVALLPQAGIQQMQIAVKGSAAGAKIALGGSDANPDDDHAEVSQQSGAITIGLVVDPTRAGVITGGATVIEQALAAISGQVTLRPLSLVPETSEQLKPFAALVIDDPSGLSPESRSAMSEWLNHGGTAIGLLGPSAQSVQLSSSLEPFCSGGRWEKLTAPRGAGQILAQWLPQDKSAVQALSHSGRLRLDGAELPNSSVALRWDDGVPLILQRSVGSGAVLTVGLPASVEVSDLALRPLFLSLLDHLLELTYTRRGPSSSVVGQPWFFNNDNTVKILGPSGLLPAPRAATSVDRGGDPGGQESTLESRPCFIPEIAGRYEVTVDGQTQQRVVTLEADEVVRPPGEPVDAHQAQDVGSSSQVDISREVSLALLGLLALELLARVLGPSFRQRTA